MANTPTSKYQVFCDTYDTKMEVSIHKVKHEQKLLINIEGKELSLYKEDVEMLIGFLAQARNAIENRF